MAEENVNVVNNNNAKNDEQNQSLERQKRIDALLSDKELKDLLIQKLLDGGHMSKGTTPNDTNAERMLSTQNPGYGNWPAFPTQFAFAPFLTPPPWAPFQTPPMTVTPINNPQLLQSSLQGSSSSMDQLGSSRSQDQGEEEEEDYVDLLDEGESLELIQFDPTVEDENAWDAGEVINSFVEKHFKRTITAEEKEPL